MGAIISFEIWQVFNPLSRKKRALATMVDKFCMAHKKSQKKDKAEEYRERAESEKSPGALKSGQKPVTSPGALSTLQPTKRPLCLG